MGSVVAYAYLSLTYERKSEYESLAVDGHGLGFDIPWNNFVFQL